MRTAPPTVPHSQKVSAHISVCLVGSKMTGQGGEMRAFFKFSKAVRAFWSSSIGAFLEKALPNFSSNSCWA